MKQLEDGRWQKEDGTILTSEQLTQLHKTATSKKNLPEDTQKSTELQEGQSSGVITLND